MHTQHQLSRNERKRHSIGLALCCGMALATACDFSSEPIGGKQVETMDAGAASKPSTNDPSRLLDSSLLPPGILEAGTDAGPPQGGMGGTQARPMPSPDAGAPEPRPDAGDPKPPQAGSVAPIPPPTIPSDPGETGPWPVGVQTLKVTLGTSEAPLEVWYPAKIGSDANEVQEIYDWNENTTVPQRGDLEAVAYFAGDADSFPSSTPSRVLSAYRAVDYPAFYVNTKDRDGMAIARRYSLCDLDFTLLAWAAWDCTATYLSQPDANEIFGFSTTAVLEAVLKGEDESASWTKFNQSWGDAEQKD